MVARLAFCNDCDYSDLDTARAVWRVFEDHGLPVQDSFWLLDPTGSELALFRGSVAEKGPRHDELLEELAAGRLGILHGGGNFSEMFMPVRPTREGVGAALEWLRARARVPRVWSNHGDHGDLTNIGAARPTYQQGDDPGSGAYVLDLLLQRGVRWFWTDNHATNDFVRRADPTGPDPLVVRERCRSGHEVSCFWRYRGALPKAPDAHTLCRQLTPAHLDALVAADGVCVIYQHLSIHRDASGKAFTARRPVFDAENLAALAHLARLRDQGALVVERVEDLLAACDPVRA